MLGTRKQIRTGECCRETRVQFWRYHGIVLRLSGLNNNRVWRSVWERMFLNERSKGEGKGKWSFGRNGKKNRQTSQPGIEPDTLRKWGFLLSLSPSHFFAFTTLSFWRSSTLKKVITVEPETSVISVSGVKVFFLSQNIDIDSQTEPKRCWCTSWIWSASQSRTVVDIHQKIGKPCGRDIRPNACHHAADKECCTSYDDFTLTVFYHTAIQKIGIDRFVRCAVKVNLNTSCARRVRLAVSKEKKFHTQGKIEETKEMTQPPLAQRKFTSAGFFVAAGAPPSSPGAFISTSVDSPVDEQHWNMSLSMRKGTQRHFW